MMDVNPVNFIDFYCSRKGKNSLSNYLKRKNLISKIECGSDSLVNFSFFQITVNLTEKGEKRIKKVNLLTLLYE